MGVKDLKNKIPKTTTFTKDNYKWIVDYHNRTGIPRTTIIDRLLSIGIENIRNIDVPQGKLKDTEKHNTYFLWEHWLFLESYANEHKAEGVMKAGLFNSIITYAIQTIESEEKRL